jgi:hypothetical protein
LKGRYLEVKEVNAAGTMIHIWDMTSAAREATGLWPSGEALADRLQAVLDNLIRSAAPEERSRLEKIRDSLVSAGRDITVGVFTAFAAGSFGQ